MGTDLVDEETQRREAWQLARLIDLGFSAACADVLLKAKVDWHFAEKVLRAAGGDHRDAYRFLI